MMSALLEDLKYVAPEIKKSQTADAVGASLAALALGNELQGD